MQITNIYAGSPGAFSSFLNVFTSDSKWSFSLSTKVQTVWSQQIVCWYYFQISQHIQYSFRLVCFCSSVVQSIPEHVAGCLHTLGFCKLGTGFPSIYFFKFILTSTILLRNRSFLFYFR